MPTMHTVACETGVSMLASLSAFTALDDETLRVNPEWGQSADLKFGHQVQEYCLSPHSVRVAQEAIKKYAMVLRYKSPSVEVHFVPGTLQDYTLLTFSPSSIYADGVSAWGQGFTERVGCNLIAVMATGPHWFPAADMVDPINVIIEVLQEIGEQPVIAYGSSMGGYAALKYGKAAGSAASISFAPQFSIDPTDLNDPRFSRYFLGDRHPRMRLEKNDLADRSYVFFDPFFRRDVPHMEKISRLSSKVRMVDMHAAGHSLVYYFASSDAFSSLIDKVVGGDDKGVVAHANVVRRQSKLRARNLAEATFHRRPETSWNIFERYSLLLNEAEREGFRQSLDRLQASK